MAKKYLDEVTYEGGQLPNIIVTPYSEGNYYKENYKDEVRAERERHAETAKRYLAQTPSLINRAKYNYHRFKSTPLGTNAYDVMGTYAPMTGVAPMPDNIQNAAGIISKAKRIRSLDKLFEDAYKTNNINLASKLIRSKARRLAKRLDLTLTEGYHTTDKPRYKGFDYFVTNYENPNHNSAIYSSKSRSMSRSYTHHYEPFEMDFNEPRRSLEPHKDNLVYELLRYSDEKRRVGPNPDKLTKKYLEDEGERLDYLTQNMDNILDQIAYEYVTRGTEDIPRTKHIYNFFRNPAIIHGYGKNWNKIPIPKYPYRTQIEAVEANTKKLVDLANEYGIQFEIPGHKITPDNRHIVIGNIDNAIEKLVSTNNRNDLLLPHEADDLNNLLRFKEDLKRVAYGRDYFTSATTRQIEDVIGNNGKFNTPYDGIIFENIKDYGGGKPELSFYGNPSDVYAHFNPNYIKSADIFTFDNGQLVPLSKRFDFSTNRLSYKNGGIIHIKPENRGKFNATKKRTGKTTEELTHSKNPLTRKRAIFAQNARKWKH